MTKQSQLKFRKIINDLKRRPEDAAEDLGVPQERVEGILDGSQEIGFDLIQKAVSVWPVNYSEFFHIDDDAKEGFKIFKASESEDTKRTMYRGGSPYYLYKDTVMSKVSSFRPEWIQELVVVDNDNPGDDRVKYNNGHFLHQFTYFIGPVNFYYMKNNKKKLAKMNTGDSMYISPYVPHTFTTRKNKENKLGHILALTYTDKVDTESLNELSAIGYDLAKKSKIKTDNELNAFKSNLINHINAASMSEELFKKKIKKDLRKIIKSKKIPEIKILTKISNLLNISLRDLLPPTKSYEVKIKKYKDNLSWFYPSNQSKNYKIVELTNLSQLPSSKALELTILSDKECKTNFEVPCHQYIYNIGETSCKINLNDKISKKFEPGDSIYLKPNIKHRFTKKAKILILRIGGRISGDILYQLSMLNDKNFQRVIEDNQPWFNK